MSTAFVIMGTNEDGRYKEKDSKSTNWGTHQALISVSQKQIISVLKRARTDECHRSLKVMLISEIIKKQKEKRKRR